jgi:hypothetical protein
MPVANHFVPFQVTDVPTVNKLVPMPIQLIPSKEYAMEFVPPPTATHRLFPHVIEYTEDVNMVAPKPIQTAPS